MDCDVSDKDVSDKRERGEAMTQVSTIRPHRRGLVRGWTGVLGALGLVSAGLSCFLADAAQAQASGQDPSPAPSSLPAPFPAQTSLPVGGGERFEVRTAVVPDDKAVYATVESTRVLMARARIGGTVGALAVDEGDRVEAGQKIAVIADEKLLLQLGAAQARERSLNAELSQATLELGRAQALRAQGTIAQQRLDEATTRARVLAQTLAAAGKDRDVVARQVEDGAVLAPGAGRVLAVSVTNGAVVLPGEALATIAAESYILRLRLPERHARFLSLGSMVRVGPRGLDPDRGEPDPAGAVWREGRVVKVFPRLDQGRVIADVQVEGLGDFFVGERVLVTVPTDRRSVVQVPGRFLHTRFGLTYARVVEGGPGEEKAVEVVVQPGRRQGDWVEVLSGLRNGDIVVSTATEDRP